MKLLRKQSIIIFSILALILVACGGAADESSEEEEVATTEVTETLDSPAVTTASQVKTGVGITEEPCPEVISNIPTGADPTKGCIYLGMLNDYSGPYGAAGPALDIGQRAFWLWANSTGGIGDYSVAIKEGFDAQYNPQKHLEGYNSLKDEVAGFSMSLGTPQTQFILENLKEDNLVAVPMSWWSGWAYKDVDASTVIEFGTQYCADGMNAVDWADENLATLTGGAVDMKTIGIIGYVTDYGLDFSFGIKQAAEAAGIEVAWEYLAPPTEFDVAHAVGLLATKPVDAYFLATGLSVAPQIAGGAAQLGVTSAGMFLGTSYNDAFVAEGSAVKGLFESGLIYAMSFGVAPYEADTVGHATMRATLSQITDSASTFFVGGWASQYNLKGVLEAALKGGDLTRAGIVRAAANVTVTSDGMMVEKKLGSGLPDIGSTFSIPDGSIGSGAKLLAKDYVGSTAKSYDWAAGPCS